MKKYLNISYLIPLATVAIFFLSLLEVYFYPGFIKKNFFISLNICLLLFTLFSFFIIKFKKIKFSNKIKKLFHFFFWFLLFTYFVLIQLEAINYRNFIYGHIHLSPSVFIYLPLLALIYIFLFDLKYFQKIFYFILPLIIIFLAQFLVFENNFEFYKFSDIRTMFSNYLLWSAFLLLSFSLFKKKSSSLIFLSCFLLLFTTINHYKIKILNASLILNDYKMIDELKNIIVPFLKDINIIKELSISLLLVTLTVLFILKFIKSKNPKLKYRFLIFIITSSFFIYPIFFPENYKKVISKTPIRIDPVNSIDNCKNNGLLFCFYHDFRNFRFPVPKDYSQSTINQIYSNIDSLLVKGGGSSLSRDEGFNPIKDLKPNIIVILSESFWDITKDNDLKFDQDPIPFSRKDFKSTLISPVFGGKTANVEFEILTGFSNNFLFDNIPYNQLINQKVPSLFSLFKEKDYLTTAIHPFTRSMYNRPTVYKHFGADKFISMEDMTYEQAGSYVSDKSFTQEILNQYNSSDKAQFIFALSMQNHTPFEANRFSKHPISFSSNLSSDDYLYLQTYIDGINLSDYYYQQLKNELIKIKKPVIVIFYGDHLPFLKNDFGIYKKINYNTSDTKKMYSTPIAIWSNLKTSFDFPKEVSPNFLSLEILKMANINPKYQFSYLQSLTKTDTVLNPFLTPKFSQEQLKEYELVQYDLLSGKQFLLK